MTEKAVRRELDKLKSKKQASGAQKFFKTGPGEYSEGDIFLGISVPQQREVAKKFQDLSLTEVEKLLESPIHEHRFTALEILVFQFEQGSVKEQKRIVEFYLQHLRRVNNWDLVDTSAPYILGEWLVEHERSILGKLSRSKNLWERRVAIVATLTLIKRGDPVETLKLAETYLNDPEDLIHKATGWMLREVGKMDKRTLAGFLDRQAHQMPRTALRYALEHFPENERKKYLTKKVR